MRFLKPIVLLLLALAWLPATNNCARAALAPSVFVHCSDEDCETGKSVPCSNQCANCVTNENGSDLAGLQVLTAAKPQWTEEAALSEVLQTALAFAKESQEEIFHPVPVDDRPPWCVVVRTVPPVRGPTLA